MDNSNNKEQLKNINEKINCIFPNKNDLISHFFIKKIDDIEKKLTALENDISKHMQLSVIEKYNYKYILPFSANQTVVNRIEGVEHFVFEYEFDDLSTLKDDGHVFNMHPKYHKYPALYIIYEKKNKKMYIGESTEYFERLVTHTKNEKKHFKKGRIARCYISDDFDNSFTYNLETKLIDLSLIANPNGWLNDKTQICHNYKRNELVESFYKEVVVADLIELGLVEKNSDILAINSNLHKISAHIEPSDDQNKVIKKIREYLNREQDNIHVLSGQPGTGKTIVTFRLFTDLAAEGKYRVCFIVGTKQMQAVISQIFKHYPNPKNSKVMFASEFITDTYVNEFDFVIIDEGHRLKWEYGRITSQLKFLNSNISPNKDNPNFALYKKIIEKSNENLDPSLKQMWNSEIDAINTFMTWFQLNKRLDFSTKKFDKIVENSKKILLTGSSNWVEIFMNVNNWINRFSINGEKKNPIKLLLTNLLNNGVESLTKFLNDIENTIEINKVSNKTNSSTENLNNKKYNELDLIFKKCKKILITYDYNQCVMPIDFDLDWFRKNNTFRELESFKGDKTFNTFTLKDQMRAPDASALFTNLIDNFFEPQRNLSAPKSKTNIIANNYDCRIFGGKPIEENVEEFAKFIDSLKDKSIWFDEKGHFIEDHPLITDGKYDLVCLTSGYDREFSLKAKENIVIAVKDAKNKRIEISWNHSECDGINSWINTKGAKSFNEMGYFDFVQGFDMNVVGVIIGRDLYLDDDGQLQVDEDFVFGDGFKPKEAVRYESPKCITKATYEKWKPVMDNNRTAENKIYNSSIQKYFESEYYRQLRALVINRYIVLLTRGIKGLYIYCTDEKLKNKLIELAGIK